VRRQCVRVTTTAQVELKKWTIVSPWCKAIAPVCLFFVLTITGLDRFHLTAGAGHSSTFRLNLSHFVTETTLRIPQNVLTLS